MLVEVPADCTRSIVFAGGLALEARSCPPCSNGVGDDVTRVLIGGVMVLGYVRFH